jgi:hypothetical protein
LNDDQIEFFNAESAKLAERKHSIGMASKERKACRDPSVSTRGSVQFLSNENAPIRF